MSFEAGLTAFKQNKFEDAIALLQEYCQECDAAGKVTSQKYMQAHTGIVKSYQQLHQLDKAIAHCQGLTNTKNTALGIWINRTLTKLEAAAEEAKNQPETQATDDTGKDDAKPSQASQDNELLLQQGLQAYKNMKRDRAIKLLEEYSQSCTKLTSRNYMTAQTTLVKAYREVKQYSKAIVLCEALSNSESFALKSWASKALPKLQEELAKTSTPTATGEQVIPNTSASAAPKADRAIPNATETPSDNATVANGAPVASSSYVFDATPHGIPNLQQVTPSSDPLSANSSSSVQSPEPSPALSSHSTSSRPSSQPGDIPDSMADGLAAMPKRTTSRVTSPNPSASRRNTSSRSSSSSGARKSGGGKAGAALLGGGLAVFLGQFLFKRMLRSGIGFVIFVVVVIARSCFSIGSDSTPLQEAVMEGNVVTVEKLLSKGKSMETSDADGNTVIFWALSAEDCDADWTYCSMSAEHEAIAELLLTQGANINVANTWQETPLHWAAGINGSVDVVQTMVGRGADINARDISQATPLHWAASAGAVANVELLLNNGADINAKDAEGYTPLDYAGNEEVATLLQSRSAVSGF